MIYVQRGSLKNRNIKFLLSFRATAAQVCYAQNREKIISTPTTIGIHTSIISKKKKLTLYALVIIFIDRFLKNSFQREKFMSQPFLIQHPLMIDILS